MVRKTDHTGRAIEAALELAAARGWQRVTLADIAQEAGLSLVELYRVCPAKACILPALARRMDEHMLAGDEAAALDEPVRDLLFDIFMRRFEAMRPYRTGLAAILRALPFDPASALVSLPGLARSMAWVLAAAGLSAQGLCGAARIKTMGVVYAATLSVWLGDEGTDMAVTMAALDRNLRRAERWAWFAGWGGRAAPAAGEPAAEGA